MIRSALAIAYVAALFACAPAAPPVEDRQLGAELAYADDQTLAAEQRVLRAIEGFYIRYPNPPEDAATGEAFLCGGVWSSGGGRGVEHSGRYRIEGDRICVETQYRNYCMTYLGREGEILTVRDDNGAEAQFSMRRAAYCEPDPAGGPSRDVTHADVRALQHLRGDELRNLVRGATFFDTASGLAHTQVFSCNGRWLGVDLSLRGRYSVTNDLVCTDVGARDQCEKYFRINDAIYAAHTLPDGRALHARRVEVLEQQPCER